MKRRFAIRCRPKRVGVGLPMATSVRTFVSDTSTPYTPPLSPACEHTIQRRSVFELTLSARTPFAHHVGVRICSRARGA